ncbi:hypothetical protein DL95DRAFT_457565 [Leptodontidium sp. 2 PMI_412]|nr:hypothetical protein DL95DRAFT_457565 [Leptodontidium sp. 2 PMI_412]
MPRTAFRLRPAFKAITDGTRALHYTLLNRTDYDDALNPTEGCEDLCSSCAKLPFDEIFTTEQIPPKREDPPPLTTSSDDNDEPPPEDTFAFDMGSFTEIENRKSYKPVFWFCTEGLQLDFVHAGLSRPDNHFLRFPFSVSCIENELRIDDFREIMNQYSQKQLTNASDALDAITGILSHIT